MSERALERRKAARRQLVVALRGAAQHEAARLRAFEVKLLGGAAFIPRARSEEDHAPRNENAHLRARRTLR